MEERVTWEKAEVALDGTKEKQKRNANDGHGKKGFHGIRAPAEKRTRRGSRTFEKYPSFIRLHERVIFDITSPRLYRSFPRPLSRFARNRVA